MELGHVLKQHGGRYFTHLRDESNGVFEAFAEAAEFGAETGVHVQIVHMKLSGTDNWGGARAPARGPGGGAPPRRRHRL